ncbi:MAG: glycosyltransferase [Verrucomicrobiaceae bacterium]|nr:MAG: glycosyltransferase [Verrucomicrobiaceae bacterium]
MQKITIINDHVSHYRIPFFEQLKCALEARGATLVVVYSVTSNPQYIQGDLPWAIRVPSYSIGKAVWQPVWRLSRDSDLVILPQVSRNLHLYPLTLRFWAGGAKIALWGHGKSLQNLSKTSFVESSKTFVSRHVHWWFAYNDYSARIVRDLGFPAGRITSLNNSVDTASLRKARETLVSADLDALKARLGISGDNVAIYTGLLYKAKRIDFLIESCRKVRAEMLDFELIIIGKGDDEEMIREAARVSPWIHFVGPKGELEKVPYWSLSKLLLLPGVVGLTMVDCLALGLPMVTTAVPGHGPEIDYFRDGEHGIMLKNWKSSDAYADIIVELLRNEDKRLAMARRCLADGAVYSTEDMVGRFVDGVDAALSAPRYNGFLKDRAVK